MSRSMRGVLLCGGEGTRLRPMTEVVNKHLVRVGYLPMAEYPLLRMIEAGIDDILVVSGGANFAGVAKYFGSGKKWGVKIHHVIQDEAGGIAQAVGMAERFAKGGDILVLLGDGVFSMPLKPSIIRFQHTFDKAAMIFSIKSEESERYGVIKYDRNVPVDIIEKPADPPSNDIVTGIYLYSPLVFDVIRKLKPSRRGELEISDVNREFLQNDGCMVTPMTGWWGDCGEMDTLIKVEERLKDDQSLRTVRP